MSVNSSYLVLSTIFDKQSQSTICSSTENQQQQQNKLKYVTVKYTPDMAACTVYIMFTQWKMKGVHRTMKGVHRTMKGVHRTYCICQRVPLNVCS